VCAARPTFLERRPHWGEGQPSPARVALQPLSLQEGRRLVEELLQKVDALPDDLRDLIVNGAEGNPFFAEELVKMLIEDGVIVKGAGGQDRWHVDLGRLSATHVPDTLAGVIQARLDRLALPERSVLQRASVVGRQFWDEAVAQIGRAEDEGEIVPAALTALRAKEMVFRRETSAFAGAQEYIFKHALLREVAYESLLKRLRRTYHGLVADWLIERGGARASEITGLIGEHLELAGRAAEAAGYLGRAATAAASRFANEEAIGYYRRALALLASTGQPDGIAAALHEGLGDVLHLVSQHTPARDAYQQAAANLAPVDRFGQARLQLKIGRTLVSERDLEGGESAFIRAQSMLGPKPELAEVGWWQEWLPIQMERATLHYCLHQRDRIESLVAEARPFVEQYGSPAQRAQFFDSLLHMELGRQRWRVTEDTLGYVRALLAAREQVDDPHAMASAVFADGFVWLWYGDLDKAMAQLQAALALVQRVGDISLLARCLTYVTIVHRQRGQVEETRQAAALSLSAAAAAQMPEYMAMARANQAWAAWRDGDLVQARELGRAALDQWSQLPLGRNSAPFLWLALWPLLAVALHDEQLAEALDHGRAMLDPGQQPLPDALRVQLEAAIQAAEEGDPESCRTQFQQAIASAQQTGYL
jgi:eukaryotic-like serine/threonine-protein kinase